MNMSQERIQNRDTAQQSSDMVERVARKLAPTAWTARDAGDGGPHLDFIIRMSLDDGRAALEASHHAELVEALESLQRAEAAYRRAHDAFGADDLKTGRAWDMMRRAGESARALLTKIGGAS